MKKNSNKTRQKPTPNQITEFSIAEKPQIYNQLVAPIND